MRHWFFSDDPVLSLTLAPLTLLSTVREQMAVCAEPGQTYRRIIHPKLDLAEIEQLI